MLTIDEGDVVVHCGDAADVLDTLPAASAQCVVTSPPYYGLRDYGIAGQLGAEDTVGEYVDRLVGILESVRRVLAEDGVLWLNLGDSYSGRANAGATFDRHRGSTHRAGVVAPQRNRHADAPHKSMIGVPWRVALAMIDAGWRLRNEVIWHKPNAMPESVADRLSSRHEHLFLLTKAERYRFDLDAIRIPHVRGWTSGRNGGRTGWDRGDHLNAGMADAAPHPRGANPGDVWAIPTQPYAGAHFAAFPSTLARRCIAAGAPEAGDVVLDPFAGSGTTLRAARDLGRPSIGVELNPAYIDLIKERIGAPVLELGDPA